jgi:hypothetical protein
MDLATETLTSSGLAWAGLGALRRGLRVVTFDTGDGRAIGPMRGPQLLARLQGVPSLAGTGAGAPSRHLGPRSGAPKIASA